MPLRLLTGRLQECPTWWRIYEYLTEDERLDSLDARRRRKGLTLGQGGEGYVADDEWCYRCGSSGHWGDVSCASLDVSFYNSTQKIIRIAVNKKLTINQRSRRRLVHITLLQDPSTLLDRKNKPLNQEIASFESLNRLLIGVQMLLNLSVDEPKRKQRQLLSEQLGSSKRPKTILTIGLRLPRSIAAKPTHLRRFTRKYLLELHCESVCLTLRPRLPSAFWIAWGMITAVSATLVLWVRRTGHRRQGGGLAADIETMSVLIEFPIVTDLSGGTTLDLVIKVVTQSSAFC
jgi:hypothetical protein